MRFLRQRSLPYAICLIAVLSIAASTQEAMTGSSVQDKNALQTGTVQTIVEHAEGRHVDIVYPLTPIYDNYPYFDITIRTPERSYVVRYESMTGYYPSAWQEGKQIKFRREKGQLMLLRYDGEFVPARIL